MATSHFPQNGVTTTTFFGQLLTLALVSLTIRVMHFLLPIEMQKRPGVSMRNIFQSNMPITAHNSLS
jgi:hypothetical protein